MRILPLLLYSKEKYPHDTQILLQNIITQTIATHNHACALLANLIYIDVANALIDEKISFEHVIDYALDFLNKERKYTHLLPNVNDCLKAIMEKEYECEIPVLGNFHQEKENYVKHLT